MTKISKTVITVSIATVDADGNTIDNVLHVSDTIDCNRPGAAIQRDLSDLNKTIKFGMDRLQAKLSVDVPAAMPTHSDLVAQVAKATTDSDADQPATKKK